MQSQIKLAASAKSLFLRASPKLQSLELALRMNIVAAWWPLAEVRLVWHGLRDCAPAGFSQAVPIAVLPSKIFACLA